MLLQIPFKLITHDNKVNVRPFKDYHNIIQIHSNSQKFDIQSITKYISFYNYHFT